MELQNLANRIDAIAKEQKRVLDISQEKTKFVTQEQHEEVMTEIKTIRDIIKSMYERNLELLNANKQLQKTIEPMASLYSKTGFLWTVVKYLFIALVAVVGFLLSLKELLRK